MQMPAELKEPGTPDWDINKYKLLPVRTDIVYHDNAGYNLTINNLPWAKKGLQRQALSAYQDAGS